jgi:hypothetical protein
MRAIYLLLVLLPMLVIVGCLADDDEATTPPPPTGNNTSATRNETFVIPLDLAGSGPGPTQSRAEGAIVVEANATGIIIEARWDCTSPTCDIDFSLVDAEGTEVATGGGGGSATLSLQASNGTGLPNGTYILRATPQAPAVQITGEARAVVFYGPIPSDFSPFADETAARSRRVV